MEECRQRRVGLNGVTTVLLLPKASAMILTIFFLDGSGSVRFGDR